MSEKKVTKLSMDELKEMKGETRPDAPEGQSLGPDFWKNARVVYPGNPQTARTRESTKPH